MNLYLLNLIGKWVGVLFVSIISSIGGYREKKITATNTNKNMSLNLTTEVIKYQTVVQYNGTKPNGEKSVLVAGEDGYFVRNNDNGTYKIIKNPVNAVIEVGTYVEPKPQVTAAAIQANSFTGKLTMYYNCPNRSHCKTSSGHNLKESVYYTDATYGNVRILSAAQSKFPKGTIVEIAGSPLGTFYGIVLDTGGDMIAEWNRGKVHMDLAIDAATEQARTYNNVTYNIKRYGF